MSETNPPPPKTVDYAKLRRRFGLAFIISTGLFVVFSVCALSLASLNLNAAPPTRPSLLGTPTAARTAVPGTLFPTQAPTPTATPAPMFAAQQDPFDTLTIAAAIVGIAGTCLTSATTLSGFVITAVLSLRQERRQARFSDLERQLQAVELEKQKLELERMRREQHKEGENKDREGRP